MKTYQIAYKNQCISHETESEMIDYTLKKIHMYGFEYFLFRLIPVMEISLRIVKR